MVLSNRCRLRGKSPLELQSCKEEVNEFGGFFVVNGIERVHITARLEASFGTRPLVNVFCEAR
jgi:hypothetical protein